MGSKLGVLKVAAKRIGVEFDEYMSNLENGLKWCHRCKIWKSKFRFGSDVTRGDGLDAVCLECRHIKVRKQRKIATPSAKVQSQASSAVSYEIKKGRMVEVTDLVCCDCGKDAEHYHHHLGYDRNHWLDVVPLCCQCHVMRHWTGEVENT